MNSATQYVDIICFIKIKLVASVTVIYLCLESTTNCTTISLFKVLMIEALYYLIISILTYCTVFTKQLNQLITVKGSSTITDLNMNS